MDPAPAARYRSAAKRLRPPYGAVRSARLEDEDALWLVHDETAVQHAKARNESEITTTSRARG